ncbi:hypothetical protein HERIO_2118 [Hepatospora eriocheir]|uniref:Uncharacterized protein n=1 Tax=Hepatospora eriocheir TaxID=1081669 RepID=A0A1X0Q848_9MICR|nr:hypothetical protein HERIO_2118 [Hepatospora eriocheir]
MINRNKYRELKRCILNEKYPIILHGPSKTGKTTNIVQILNNNQVSFQFIDLQSIRFLNAPLKKVINVVMLNDLYEFNKIKYDKNLIIESNIEHFEKREPYNIIKVNRDKNDEDEILKINLFRFLGRIFYNKLNIIDIIDVSKDEILINNVKNDDNLNYTLQSSDKIKMIEIDVNMSRKIYDDFSDESSFQLSSDFDSQEVIIKEEFEKEYLKTSYKFNTTLWFLYSNIPCFVEMKDLGSITDLLSLTDLNNDYLLPLIGNIMMKSNKKLYGFKGFKGPDKRLFK